MKRIILCHFFVTTAHRGQHLNHSSLKGIQGEGDLSFTNEVWGVLIYGGMSKVKRIRQSAESL